MTTTCSYAVSQSWAGLLPPWSPGTTVLCTSITQSSRGPPLMSVNGNRLQYHADEEVVKYHCDTVRVQKDVRSHAAI